MTHLEMLSFHVLSISFIIACLCMSFEKGESCDDFILNNIKILLYIRNAFKEPVLLFLKLVVAGFLFISFILG